MFFLFKGELCRSVFGLQESVPVQGVVQPYVPFLEGSIVLYSSIARNVHCGIRKKKTEAKLWLENKGRERKKYGSKRYHKFGIQKESRSCAAS